MSLKTYDKSEIAKHIAMSDTEVYIGPKFYQNYSNHQTE